MQHLIKENWTSGSGVNFTFEEIVNILNLYILNGAKVFIGTDSFIANKKVCFASALCLHGEGKSGRYFFIKENLPNKMYKNLSTRITEEARRSVEIGCHLMDKYYVEPANIELHMDISPFSAGNATSKFSDML